jgi:gamma-glutamyl hydrolase
MEAHRYPFFGVQYHPERSIFNWNPFEAIDHSHHTIAASQYVGRRFIMSAAQSRHRFADEDAENAAMIDNFAPFFSRRYMRVNMQMYFF